MVTTDDFAQLIAGLEYGLGTTLHVVQNVSFQPDAFLAKIRQFGFEAIESTDGPISIVRETGDTYDSSRQSGPFPIHTDGLYHERVPELLVLFCQDPGAGTTPTIVADSRAVFRRPGRRKRMELLNGLELVYLGKDGREFPRPFVQRHPVAHFSVAHLGNRTYLRAKPTAPRLQKRLSPQRAAKIARALRAQIQAAMCLRHYWRADEALVIDNYTFVHGREALEVDHRRRLLRLWLSATDRSPTQSGSVTSGR
ncbi:MULTISPECIES: TauD/TfdA family dioxygenase [unclassified Bradyrhizobium]